MTAAGDVQVEDLDSRTWISATVEYAVTGVRRSLPGSPLAEQLRGHSGALAQATVPGDLADAVCHWLDLALPVAIEPEAVRRTAESQVRVHDAAHLSPVAASSNVLRLHDSQASRGGDEATARYSGCGVRAVVTSTAVCWYTDAAVAL
jgi:hypothetical protein